jgi:hypothetical protein
MGHQLVNSYTRTQSIRYSCGSTSAPPAGSTGTRFITHAVSARKSGSLNPVRTATFCVS